MARIARAVAPGFPHHVTQRGNRRQQAFFNDEDYQSYLALMSEWCMRFRVETWAYCLMPNHVHLIVVPETKDGLNLAIGEAHRRYTRRINFREDWRWSSAAAHITGKDDILVKTEPLLELANKPWKQFLAVDVEEPEIELFRKHERTGRPLGEDAFIEKLEHLLDRTLKPQKPGPKGKNK